MFSVASPEGDGLKALRKAFPVGVVQRISTGRKLQENPGNSIDRANLTEFQAPQFECSEPRKISFPHPLPVHSPTGLPFTLQLEEITYIHFWFGNEFP